MKNKRNVLWLCGAGFVLLMIIGSILWFGNEKEEDTITVGVILPGSSEEPGWNGIHYQGIKTACDELGMKIKLYENAAEYSGECEEAIQEMTEDGIRIIFLESYNYPDEVGETIEKHPEIAFYCSSAESDMGNYTNYFARVYQARYLSGIVAGMTTTSQHVGYVAAMDNSEVNRGINAFALGVRSVCPEAVVHVVYTGAWDDGDREKSEAAALVENCGVDVLTYHQNQPFIVEEAEELGVDVIGFNIEQGEHSDYLLTSVVSNWDMVYREILGDYLQKKESGSRNYWIGIEKNAVGLAFYSDRVSQEVRNAVSEAADQLRNDREVFSGTIYDNTGNLRCDENEVVRDEVLLNQMDWLVEGVEVYEIN